MSFLARLFGRTEPPQGDGPGDDRPDEEGPFMEHPTGEFPTARSAIESAVGRLRSLERWDDWITFSGQGMGTHPDSCHIVDIRMRDDILDTGIPGIPLDEVLECSGLSHTGITTESLNGSAFRLVGANPAQAATFLDALFSHLGVRPFDGEDDYAVGAEW